MIRNLKTCSINAENCSKRDSKSCAFVPANFMNCSNAVLKLS